MRTYNEGDGVEFIATFADASGDPAAPSNVYWRLDCVTSNQTLQDWTLLTPTIAYDEFGSPSSVTVQVDIPSSLNAIVSDANRRETKELTIAAGLNTDRQKTKSLQYAIVNRRFA